MRELVPCHLLLALLGWWIEVDAAGGEGQGDALPVILPFLRFLKIQL